MKKIKNILFYYPSRTIGGTQYLYSRCANYLVQNSDYSIYYVDYEDGFAASRLLRNEVKILHTKDNEKVILPEDSICIIQLNFLDLVYEKVGLSHNNYFMFWAITPASLTVKVRVKGIPVLFPHELKDLGQHLLTLSNGGVIAYMDFENYYLNATKFSFSIPKRNYVPVPVDERSLLDGLNIRSNVQHDSFVFAWLGRLDADKANTLITFMNELNSLNNKCKKLYIIGTGDKEDLLKWLVPKYHYPIEFTGPLIGCELNDFIDKYVDVGLGMGTSALEFAKRCKPVIMRGFMNKIERANVSTDYFFASEIFEYTLGDPHIKLECNTKFRKKIERLHTDYYDVAKNCYEYVSTNHTCRNTCAALEESIKKIYSFGEENALREIDYCIKVLKTARKRIDVFCKIKKLLLLK